MRMSDAATSHLQNSHPPDNTRVTAPEILWSYASHLRRQAVVPSPVSERLASTGATGMLTARYFGGTANKEAPRADRILASEKHLFSRRAAAPLLTEQRKYRHFPLD